MHSLLLYLHQLPQIADNFTTPLSTMSSQLSFAIRHEQFRTRKEIVEAIKLEQFSVKPSKTLKACEDFSDSGTAHTLKCTSGTCQFRVSVKKSSKDGIKLWRVGQRKGVVEQLEHCISCMCAARPSPMLVSATLKAKNLTIKDVSQLGVRNVDPVFVSRLKSIQRLEANQSARESLHGLPTILAKWMEQNPCSKVVFAKDLETHEMKRVIMINQATVSAYETGFLRNLYSIDGGHIYYSNGKAYRLVVIYGTTGNNQNIMVGWSICDGETAENIVAIVTELANCGIILNANNVVIISDQGSAIKKAIVDSMSESAHMFCAKHWIGYNKANWGVNNRIFLELVKVANTE